MADKSNTPKPLRKVCGLPLIRHVILNSARAGLKRLVLVVGFQKEKVIEYINNNDWPLKIDIVENPHWKKSNGLSVLAAKDKIKENFILMMSDHVFDYRTLKELRVQDLRGCDGLLAVDYKIHQIFDKDDATKVDVQGDKIEKIEKNLVNYNAIDTGMFLLSPAVFKALESSKQNEDCHLSDGIRKLSSQNKMGVFDIGERFWQDVDTKASLKYAEKNILNGCRKKTDGFVSRHLNRHVSLFITSHLIKTPITANQFTLFVLLLGLLSGYLAMLGGYSNYLIAALIFKLTSILDGVDGEISKIRHTASKFGQWLDTICDNVTYVVFIVGTVVGLYRINYEFVGFLSVFALFGMSMLLVILFFYLIKRSDSGSLLALQKEYKSKKDLPLLSRFFVSIQFVIKRDFFALLFLFFALINKPQWVLFVTGLATNIAWVVVLWSKIKARVAARQLTQE